MDPSNAHVTPHLQLAVHPATMTYQPRNWRLYAFFICLLSYSAGVLMSNVFMFFDLALNKPVAADPFVVLLTAQGWSGPLTLAPAWLSAVVVVLLLLLLLRRLYLGVRKGKWVGRIHWSVAGIVALVALSWCAYAVVFALDRFGSMFLLHRQYIALLALPNYFLGPLLILSLDLYTGLRELISHFQRGVNAT